MTETYDEAAAVEAQKEYCKEWAARHPEDWASAFMKEGRGFAPVDGRCWACHQQIYSAEGQEKIYSRRRWESTGRILKGISVERARKELTTGCPFCHRSYVD